MLCHLGDAAEIRALHPPSEGTAPCTATSADEMRVALLGDQPNRAPADSHRVVSWMRFPLVCDACRRPAAHAEMPFKALNLRALYASGMRRYDPCHCRGTSRCAPWGFMPRRARVETLFVVRL